MFEIIKLEIESFIQKCSVFGKEGEKCRKNGIALAMQWQYIEKLKCKKIDLNVRKCRKKGTPQI